VSILLGKGDGTFQSANNYLAGYAPWSVAMADFNSDGKLDLTIANAGSGTVRILLGKGERFTIITISLSLMPFGSKVEIPDNR
jgi:FG-GAP-like repeat